MEINTLAAKVEALSGFGIPPADIAIALSLGLEELTSEYQAELQGGAIKANARVAESLFRKAIGEGRESVIAAIFWLKTRARWKETHVQEHIGGGKDEPVKFVVTYEAAPPR
ncbi:MAG: hypothetical protein MEQ84_11515 [Mesorhizobium sp.]|nr:hypothetical protein [Mesorhizobium sp.]